MENLNFLPHKTEEILLNTSEILSIDVDVTKSVIAHVFDTVNEYVTDGTSPSIRLPHLGELVASPWTVDQKIRRLVKHRHTPYGKERLRRLFILRREARLYKESKDFKKRFGSWHWKKAN